MNNYRLLNNVLGWVTFVIATATYLMTMEPTGSFWDCGEFIACAFKLEVGHPPGAPFFMLLGRIATMFGNSADPASYARMANALSGIASGFTILFLFWTITAMAKKLFAVNNEEMSQGNIFAIMGAGLVGALTYAFSDTFWFSAVEGEVYATSSMFTALVFWLIMKWDQKVEDGDPRADRYLILIAYFIGISIGVHLLNLLCIPAIAYIYYFRKYPNVNRKGFIIAGIIGFATLMFVQYGIIPGFVSLAARFEMFFVNNLKLGFNSGLLFYVVFIAALVVGGIIYTKRKGLVNWNTIFISLAVILIGYSSYAIILIRSNAQTPMNENDPSNAFSLLSYLNRDQYGERPLLYGQYFNAPLNPAKRYKDGNPIYFKDVKNKKYSVADSREGQVPNYDPNYCTVFPRMWSSDHAAAYRDWANIKGPANKKPSYGANMRFLFRYQMDFMWFRYFMWNFSGRQNDIQGSGDIMEGNWITGITPVDNIRLGNQGDLPAEFAKNKGKNKYYMLPFILGIIGLIFQFIRDNKRAWTVLLLFLFMGVLINVFLNPTPQQPRERDYAYVGSFYAYSIWVGLGILGIYDLLRKRTGQQAAALGATALGVLVSPVLLAKENWDDHDRSHRYTSADFARNYLDSCAPNAILFTNGDNDTFPLWYVQEVEGYRTDVRVVNLSLLNTGWYVDQMKRKAYDSDPVPFSLTQDEYRDGTNDAVFIRDEVGDTTKYMDISMAMKQIRNSGDVLRGGGKKAYHYFKSPRLVIPVDKEKVLKNGTVPPELADSIAPIYWNLGERGILYKKDLMILDLLASNNWERPVYFAITVGDDSYLNLEPYFSLEGLAYRVIPVRQASADGQIGTVNTKKMYDNLVNKFHWGNMDREDVYLDENNLRMTMNFRNNFARLALALMQEGKKDLAKKALDRCLEVMPEKTVPYNYYCLLIAQVYFELGEKTKANEIIEKIRTSTTAEYNYYISLSPSDQKSVEGPKRRAQYILGRIENLLKFMEVRSKLGMDTLNQSAGQQKNLPAKNDTPAKQAGSKPN